MPINTINNNPTSNTKTVDTASTGAQRLRSDQNVAILEAQQQVSLNSKNEPLALLFKTALQSINEQLEPVLGPNAVESVVEQGIDYSPEATAERIISQSTGFFSAFQQQNEGVEFSQQLDDFLAVISRGIDQGFNEARTILESLQVLGQGDIAANIETTYDLVQVGLIDFRLANETENKT